MTSRAIYALVNELLEQARAADVVLATAVATMRCLRGMPPLEYFPVRADLVDRCLADPQWRSLLGRDDTLSFVRQSLNAPSLQRAYRSAGRGIKFTLEQIPSVSQLFTPEWVVRFLVQNTLGRLWVGMHPDSQLPSSWEYFVAPESSPVEARPVASIRVLDPAAGTMNFGLGAIDLLWGMYREEMDRAGRPGWPAEPSARSESEIPELIVRQNLHGIDIDLGSLELARHALCLKFRRDVPEHLFNLHCADSLFADPMKPVDVLVTNPPYVSRANLDRAYAGRVRKRYPHAFRDLYAAFLARSLELLAPGGLAGFLTMHSFMFTADFETLRTQLATQASLLHLAHFGGGLFDLGNRGTLQTAAFTLQNASPSTDHRVSAFRLLSGDGTAKQTALRKAIADRSHISFPQQQFHATPRRAWIYWATAQSLALFSSLPPLSTIAPPRQGLATTDNARSVRYWWEVTAPVHSPIQPTPGKWFPYAKSGRFRRWYGQPLHRVNWQHDGAEIKAAIVAKYPYLEGDWSWVAKNSAYYLRPGITYSYLTSGRFSARLLPAGCLFDVAGSSLFPDDPLTLLAILNSSTARSLLEMINPTVNFQVGDLAQLPIPESTCEELRLNVSRAVELQRQLDTFDETTPDFLRPMPLGGCDLHLELYELERTIDRQVAGLYGCDNPPTDRPPPSLPGEAELACRWIGFAVGNLLGRWSDAPQLPFLDLADVGPVESELRRHLPLADVARISSAAGGLGRFLKRHFLPWHEKLYAGCPVYCLIDGRLVPHWSIPAESLDEPVRVRLARQHTRG